MARDKTPRFWTSSSESRVVDDTNDRILHKYYGILINILNLTVIFCKDVYNAVYIDYYSCSTQSYPLWATFFYNKVFLRYVYVHCELDCIFA